MRLRYHRAVRESSFEFNFTINTYRYKNTHATVNGLILLSKYKIKITKTVIIATNDKNTNNNNTNNKKNENSSNDR